MATRSRKLTGSAASILGYFEQQVGGLEEYYSDTPGSSQGEDDDIVFSELWGNGAEHLGVDSLTRTQFEDLINGRWEGEQLVGSGYRKVVDKETGIERTETGVRTVMIDVVYAAPKSVAEYLVACQDEDLRRDIIEAWKESVHEAFESLQDHAAVARVPIRTPSEVGKRTASFGPNAGNESKMQGSATKRVTADLIGLPVIQFTARPTDETIERRSPPDPHLHAHVPIIAVAWVPDGEDVRTYTPDEQGIRKQAAEREAVLSGSYARRLEDLGIAMEYVADRKGKHSWEIAGSNPAVRTHLSTNHTRATAVKDAFEEQYGRPPTDGEVSSRLYATRHAKDDATKEMDTRPAWDQWAESIERAGLPLQECPRRVVERAPLAQREDMLRDRLFATSGLTRSDALFDRETVHTVVAEAAVGLGLTRVEVQDFERRLVADELVPVRTASDPRWDLFTTDAVIRDELTIGLAIETKAAAALPRPTDLAVSRAIRTATVDLDVEQRAAVAAACSERGWVTIEGHAGTGKTTALQAVVAAYRDTTGVDEPAADQVIVVSTAATTAERTGRPLEADRASSIESFVHAVEKGACTPTERTLILVDEAAMVDTHRMAQLVEAVGPARIVCVGDPAQLSPIGAGGWYADHTSRHEVVELTHVHRQRDVTDVRDYAGVRSGAATAALASLQERGRVHVVDDRESGITAAVDLWRAARAKGWAAEDVKVVLEGSNREVDTVNRLIQRQLRDRGEIPDAAIALHDTQTDRRWTVHDGDHVVFLAAYRRDGQRAVRNGETGTVIGLDAKTRRVIVETDRHDVITVDLEPQQAQQPLGLSYAMHVAKYQGGEADMVIALPSGAPIATQNSGYTQLTRATVQAHVVVDKATHGEDPVAGLARAWSRPVSKRSATSQLDPEVVAHRRAAAEYERPAQREVERHAEPEPHWEPVGPERGSLEWTRAEIRRQQEEAVQRQAEQYLGRTM